MSNRKLYNIKCKDMDVEGGCTAEDEASAARIFCSKHFSDWWPPYLDGDQWCVQNSMTICRFKVTEK